MLNSDPNILLRCKKAFFFLACCSLFLFSNVSYGLNSCSLPSGRNSIKSQASLARKSAPKDILVEKKHRQKSSKKNTKKALFIVPHLVIGGLDRAFIDMLHFLPRRASEYDVCILHRGGEFECLLPRRTHIVSLKRAQRSTYGTVVSYAHWIDPALWVGRIHAKRYVQWLHADLSTIGGTVPLHKKKGRKGIDYFVGVSKAASNSLIQVSRKLRHRTITIHNCVDADEILSKSLETQNEIIPDNKKVNVVTVCRLSPEKGIARLIRVHGRLNKKGIDFRWYFVGSGGQQAEFEKLAKAEGLEGKVFFLGYKMNPYPYMKAADINVLGSYSESWGLVITEAMILHRPVLSTLVGGSVEQIKSGINGLIVPNSDDGLYNGLKELIQSKETRERYIEALANFHYDNDVIVEQIQNLLYPNSQSKKSKKKRHAYAKRKGFSPIECLTNKAIFVRMPSSKTLFNQEMTGT